MKLIISSQALGNEGQVKKQEVTWNGDFDSAVEIICKFAGSSPVHNEPSEEFKKLYAAAAAAQHRRLG